MYQSLNVLVLYSWMLQDLCTHLSSSPRWRLLLVNVSLYHDWSYVELVYLLNFSTLFGMSSNWPLTKCLLSLTAPSYSACWEVLLEACRQLTKVVDCASTGLYPSELHYHTLWWEGPDWLKLDESQWSCQPHALVHLVTQEEKTVSLHVRTESKPPVIPFTQYSNFSHLIHFTIWILQFIHNCQAKKHQIPKQLSFLTIQ